MQKRYVAGSFDSFSDFVHGVGTEHDTLCASLLKTHSRLRQNISRLLPIPLRLTKLNLMEIYTVQQNLC